MLVPEDEEDSEKRELPGCDCFKDENRRKKPRGYIPYSQVYESQEDVRKQGYWIPNLPVYASIVNVAKDTSTNYHILNPFVYTIQLEHGKFKWTVEKRYKDFSWFSQRLLAHRAVERLKAPVRRTHRKIKSIYGLDHKDGCPYKYTFDSGGETEDESEDDDVQVLGRTPDLGDQSHAKPRRPSYEQAIEEEPVQNGADDKPKRKRSKRRRSVALPHFPMVPDSMVSEEHMNERKEKLEAWLRHTLEIPVNRNYHETAEFLEVSRYSFINEIGGKYKEGKMKKRPGGGRVYTGIKQCCVRWFVPWGRRWLIVKDTYVCYMHPSSEIMRSVLLMDESFSINSDEFATAIKGNREFVISNQQHVLHLKCQREEDAEQWKETIKKVMDTTGTIWLNKKRFGSFAPERKGIYCQWFIDARAYMEKAAAMMELARDEIFIADWWLCPEIYMRRPMAEGNKWRLDQVLLRAAERGVRVFILLYKEVEMALGLGSLYAKRYLQGLHKNIKVMRHPDHFPGISYFLIKKILGTGTFFWAHHEKLLIIDQLIGFVGGVDLCYGRWDDNRHVLTDLGSVQYAPKQPADFTMTHGLAAAAGIATSSFTQPSPNAEEEYPTQEEVCQAVEDAIGQRDEEEKEAIEPKEKPRKKALRDVMARVAQISRMNRSTRSVSEQDEGLAIPAQQRGRSTDGEDQPDRDANYEAGRHQRDRSSEKTPTDEDEGARIAKAWKRSGRNPLSAAESRNRNLVRRVVANLKTTKAKKRWRYVLESEDLTEDYTVGYYRQEEQKVDMSELVGAGKLFPGKDYVNFIYKDFVDVQDAYNDFIDRYRTPRMPWHDIHSLVYGEAGRDLARHFIQRWNSTKTEKLKDNDEYPYLLPKSYDSIKIPRVFINNDTHKADVQVLRSVSNWSALVDGTESSIQQAYLSLIANSKHYVYIENQFFVSMINSLDVSNEVCKVICERIIRAHRENETYRVFVMVPLLPGFEGDIGSNQYSALLAVLNWTYLSINRGPHSLFECLKKAGVEDPWKYIIFTGLRTHDELCGKLVSELIYIHSKLMIVDDLYTIIGSANINDRSQTGHRDSEVCVLVTDTEFVPSTMNGRPYQAGKFASSLRKNLMKEHLCLHANAMHHSKPEFDIELDDPVADSFFVDVWCRYADENTKIYEDVFRTFPTNLVTSFDELLVWKSELPMSVYNPDQAKEKLKNLVGSLVLFPMDFLKRENLAPTIATKEGLVPSAMFT